MSFGANPWVNPPCQVSRASLEMLAMAHRKRIFTSIPVLLLAACAADLPEDHTDVGVVPSAHNISLGQKVRGDTYRFLMRAPLREHLATLASGTTLRVHISERRIRESKERNSYVAVVNGISMPGEDEPWLDPGVPLSMTSHRCQPLEMRWR